MTNVEYTEFERLGISDECAENSQYSRFPANTNVLYVGLQVASLFRSALLIWGMQGSGRAHMQVHSHVHALTSCNKPDSSCTFAQT